LIEERKGKKQGLGYRSDVEGDKEREKEKKLARRGE
jgi:hypothetical protein